MTYNEDIEYQIKDAQRHFKSHVATWFKVPGNEIEILDWRMPDTCFYAMRVIFDNERGGRMYISGDIGEAVVYPTCQAALKDVALCFTSRTENGKEIDVNEGYFLEKVRTASNRWCWDEKSFVEDFKKKVKDLEEWGGDSFDVDAFLDDRLGYSKGEFSFLGGNGMNIDENKGITIEDCVGDELEKLDPDYTEWFYDCGRRIHPRVILWLVGLRLAYEQIKAMIKAPKEGGQL